MSMRISDRPAGAASTAGGRLVAVAALCLLAVACGNEGNADYDPRAAASKDGDPRIACAPSGAVSFSRSCFVERIQGEQGLELILHHDDGHFRRLLVTRDGRGIAAADGAQEAVVDIVGPGEIEVELGGDRYRLPATLKRTGPLRPHAAAGQGSAGRGR